MSRNSKNSEGDGGFRHAVSSQFHNVHAYDSHHTKGEPWNSPMKKEAVLHQDYKTYHNRPAPPPLIHNR